MSEKTLKDGDYVAEDGCLWVRVKDVSLRIFSHPNSPAVSVHAYPVGQEDDDEVLLDDLFARPDERCFAAEIRAFLTERFGDDEEAMCEALDNIVHDVATHPASAINNGGIDEQISYIVSQCGDLALKTVTNAFE